VRQGITSKIRSAAWYAKAALHYRRPGHAIYFGDSLGDNLLCTAVARELHRRGVKGIWMLSNHPELFRNNRDIIGSVPFHHRQLRLAKFFRVPLTKAAYWKDDGPDDNKPPLDRHVISCMCRSAGVVGKVTLRPYFILSAEERARYSSYPWQIAVQSSAGSALYPAANKEWFINRFQTVVNALRGQFDFVQIGLTGDPKLDGTTDLRGATSIRETAAVLSGCRLYLGLEGFLMHLARAVECRSVVVLGGRTQPAHFCYSCNENLATLLPCSPCWQSNHCDFDRECMRQISVERVVAAIRKQIARFGTPLAEDVDDIPIPLRHERLRQRASKEN
jgi:hypothetical protein